MKTKAIRGIFLAVTLALPACQGGIAGQSYAPVVDLGASNKDQSLYAGDIAACQQLGAQTSQIADAAKGAGVGALGGAGAGAVGGAIKGGRNVAEGAGLGALTGAVVGGGYSFIQANRARQDTVIECLRGRGWKVVGR